MHSDKLGLSPASLSPESETAAAEALTPPEAGAAEAPVKRPRRTLTRKPKASAPAEAEAPAASDTAVAPAAAMAAEPAAVGPPAADLSPPVAVETTAALAAPAAAAQPEAVAAPPPASAPVAEVIATPAALPAQPVEAQSAPAASLPAALAFVAHRVYPVALGRKREALQQLLAGTGETPILLYTRTKHGADKIARFLERCGIKSAAIHGDKSHGARQRAIGGFKSGELKVLVVTDIAARLLDVDCLPLVLSYDLPHVADDYVQRVLRCGSAEAPGQSLVLITQEEAPQFRGVRDLLPQPLELVVLPGFEAAEPFDPARDPPVRADGEAGDGEAAPQAAPVAAAQPQAGDTRREGRNRRDRRNRNRGEQRANPAGEVDGEALAALDEGQGVAPAPQEARPPRNERPPRREKERREKPEIGNRALPPPPQYNDDDEDGPQLGNTLDLPPPSQYGLVGGNYRGRGRRRDPFAPVVIDEDRASIWDERQPDDYRDQWSILGPERGRPAWTYAQDGNVEEAAPPRRQFQGPPQPRRGGPPRPQQGGHRGGGQRHGRARRAEGR